MPTETHIDVDDLRVWTPPSIEIDPNILRDYTIIEPSELRSVNLTRVRDGGLEYEPFIATEMPTWKDFTTTYEIWGCGNARCPYKNKCQRYQEDYYSSNDENTCKYFEQIVD